ncbi:PREDICTED: thioredoxin H2-like [Lupinus angustifolius]|uniref:thioredoxin H2-like n=1 Tax=Lupinus angustifolius TaxID=3871 RepID=UPI00092FB8E3|nr:PREDICTED: thioredoxin H2-like [Lupinus angustifolius]
MRCRSLIVWELRSNFNLFESQKRKAYFLTFHSAAKWKAYFDSYKETNKLMVIGLMATWCVPCKYMEPVIRQFAAKYTDVEFIKLDVDVLMEVAQTFQVQAIPSFILMKKGKVVEKVMGPKREELHKLIEKHKN